MRSFGYAQDKLHKAKWQQCSLVHKNRTEFTEKQRTQMLTALKHRVNPSSNRTNLQSYSHFYKPKTNHSSLN